MSRTDAMRAAIVAILEQHRSLLDRASIRAVRLDVKFSADAQVRTTLFIPEIEMPSPRS